MAGLLESQGRALIAKGDVVMARAVLARARERGLAGQVDANLLAAIAVETGEAAYLAGDIASSESEARRALGQAGVSSAVRLRARNVLGKLLLARGLWDQADAHFAADTSEAARLGEHVTRSSARCSTARSRSSGPSASTRPRACSSRCARPGASRACPTRSPSRSTSPSSPSVAVASTASRSSATCRRYRGCVASVRPRCSARWPTTSATSTFASAT